MKYSARNHELHRLVREISGQSVASALLERLNGQLVRHQFQLSLRPGRLRTGGNPVRATESMLVIGTFTRG